jgi:hypothetical protein
MNQRLKKLAIPGLRWTLSMVVLLESVQFTFSPSAVHHFARTDLPQWIRPALGGSEIVAVLLFLLPVATLVGGYLLLFILVIAVVIHFLHGEFDVGSLIVYGMAVVVCMAHRNKEAVEVSHD